VGALLTNVKIIWKKKGREGRLKGGSKKKKKNSWKSKKTIGLGRDTGQSRYIRSKKKRADDNPLNTIEKNRGGEIQGKARGDAAT